MKLVEINVVCGTGSTGRIAVQIAREAEKRGVESLIVYGRGTSTISNSHKIGSDLDNKIHGLITRVFDMHGLGSRRATKRLVKFLKEQQPDIVHLHLLHGYYLNYEILFEYLSQNDIPVIWTMHDCWAFTGHCAYFDIAHCEKWKTGCGQCALKCQFPSSLFLDNSKSNFRRKAAAFQSVKNMTIVTPSIWLAKLVKQSFLGKYETIVINNGIDLSVFQPTPGVFRKKIGLENKKMLLGVAYGFDKRKGFDDFIELSKYIPSDMVIVLVGLSEGQMANLPHNVIGIGRTESVQELTEAYSDAMVFLNLTYEDNFPTVNMEALACGTPVITYRTGGSPESITKECGFVVEKHDIDGVLEAINSLEQHPISTNSCREQAQKYSLETSYGKYVDLIYKVRREK